ncbi:hypothetical protein SAMN06265348_10650 [Pedobacter westerhofensis]|uniref:Uncharacterized protein n=1 Tax=Pedobacter westerhofensis TaxID=425512 RepID=A0A521DNU5_9SPHI|nr:hypothetical protein [Pedobacter westerhofensis]SMO73376.1 hypothetical protein SAMN06265348_10650 [Pedobacter westerhofensis]
MENNNSANEPLQEQQQTQNQDHQTAGTDANQDQTSLASDGPISKSEGTDSPDLTDVSAENSEENSGLGIGDAAPGISNSNINEQEPITQETAQEGQDETELNNSDSDQQTLDNSQEGYIEKDISQQQANALDTSSENDTQP